MMIAVGDGNDMVGAVGTNPTQVGQLDVKVGAYESARALGAPTMANSKRAGTTHSSFFILKNPSS